MLWTRLSIPLARISVLRHPESPESWIKLGLAYERCGLRPSRLLGKVLNIADPFVRFGGELDPDLFRRAISAYQRAISLKPAHAQAWAHLGGAYARRYRRGYYLGDDRIREGLSDEKRQGLEIAADAYQRAIQSEPNHALGWNALGFVYGELDRLDDEVNAYRQVIRIRPDFVEAWHNLTTVYYNQRQFDKVAQVCQEAVKHIPLDAHSWYDCGDAWEKLGRLEDAAEAYLQAVRLKPHFPGPWVRGGVVYAKLGRVDDAVSVLCDYIESKTKLKNKFFFPTYDLKESEDGQAVLHRLEALYPRFIKKELAELEK